MATVGKRLSSRLFATYEQSLRGVWNILKLQYEITDRLSSSVQAGSDSAVDTLWFFPFD
jgi:translocation and assembly module TamB